MIKFITTKNVNEIAPTVLTLQASFDDDQNQEIIKDKNFITNYYSRQEAMIFLGEREKFCRCELRKTVKAIVGQNQTGYIVDLKSFVTPKLDEGTILEIFTLVGIFESHTLWNLKTGENAPKRKKDLLLLSSSDELHTVFSKLLVEARNINLVRNLQQMPHNLLNSEIYETKIREIFATLPQVELKVLSKKEAVDEQMGLFLSVNAGSAYEPKCIVLTYRGNPESSEHTALIGKGITFDSGGMNLKPERYMQGMKFDMSGSAIVAGTVKTAAELGAKTNVSAILMVTDNMISPFASKPDDVVIASNGLSVEINNTDAEGRLVMADGLVYAWKRLNATKLVDVSTLTGAILIALGKTYTGAWSTSETEWTKFSEAAKISREKVWRMPFHDNYLEYMKKSKVADLRNTDYTGKAGSSNAGMFLRQFTNNLPYIHLDIAGSAGTDDEPTGIMIRTLAEYIIK